MRDRDSIHHDIDEAQADLEANLAELRDVVRHEVDPKVNAQRALDFGERKVREGLQAAWAELLSLWREVRHTADHAGLRAALMEVFTMLRAAMKDLPGTFKRFSTPHVPAPATV